MKKLENELKVILENESVNEMALLDPLVKIFNNEKFKEKIEQMFVSAIENNPNVLNAILKKLKINIELEKK